MSGSINQDEVDARSSGGHADRVRGAKGGLKSIQVFIDNPAVLKLIYKMAKTFDSALLFDETGPNLKLRIFQNDQYGEYKVAFDEFLKANNMNGELREEKGQHSFWMYEFTDFDDVRKLAEAGFNFSGSDVLRDQEARLRQQEHTQALQASVGVQRGAGG